MTVPLFKLKTVSDRSCNSAGPRAWNSLPPSLWADALACSNATLGNVSALLCRYSWPVTLATTHLTRLLVRPVVRKLADSVPIAPQKKEIPGVAFAESLVLCTATVAKS